MTAAGRICVAWLAAGAIVASGGCSSGAAVQIDAGSLPEPVLDAGGPGGEAAVPPDGKALCPVGPCNFQTGEGCPANMTCAPSSADGKSPVCEPAGATALDAPCATWTQCVAGSICAGGFCRKLCCGRDWTGCTQGEHCIRKLEVLLNGETIDTQAYLCFPVNYCSALDPASCTSTERGTTCQIVDPTGATACLPDGAGVAGDPCPCKGGYTCVNNGCRRLCKAVAGGGEPSCPATEGRCVHFTRDPDGVGECTPI